MKFLLVIVGLLATALVAPAFAQAPIPYPSIRPIVVSDVTETEARVLVEVENPQPDTFVQVQVKGEGYHTGVLCGISPTEQNRTVHFPSYGTVALKNVPKCSGSRITRYPSRLEKGTTYTAQARILGAGGEFRTPPWVVVEFTTLEGSWWQNLGGWWQNVVAFLKAWGVRVAIALGISLAIGAFMYLLSNLSRKEIDHK